MEDSGTKGISSCEVEWKEEVCRFSTPMDVFLVGCESVIWTVFGSSGEGW